MENKTQHLRLTRGGFLSALAFSVTCTMGILQGCSSGGGVTDSTPTPTPTAIPTATPVPTATPIPTPTPVPTGGPTRSYQLTVRGSRGSVPLELLKKTTLLTPGSTVSATTSISIADLLIAPTLYGDRRFAGWEYKGARFSTAAAINDLPVAVVDGDTITAVYEPAGTGVKPLTPNYDDTEPAFWAAPGNLKIFFDPNVSADMQAVIREGIERWMKALGSSFGYSVVTNQASAQIVIKMGAVASSSAFTSVGYVNNASPTPIEDAVMIFDPAKLPSITDPENRKAVVALACHEFGHALGIGEHSTVSTDTMFPSVSNNTLVITQRDLNTMMNMYNIFDGRSRPISRATGTGRTRTKIVDCQLHIAPKS
ncbi:matrixin family metalloprotease [Armatimonas sp.]|uniref:matrixin family metalloprotease n=1 Tax=Armatimonas sp. TaxID=1872638 RepID=UPI00286CC890|nr:matrixin family metalloprotease [Armatimonas sp.]